MEQRAASPVPHPRIISTDLPRAPIPMPSVIPTPGHPANAQDPFHSNHSSPGPSSPVERNSPSASASASALARHQLHRSLSPDLPTRDALYLFCNFASYMRSPHEGSEGVKDNTDFHDTIRLLDYARTLAAQPHANVNILHLKYRFQIPDQNVINTGHQMRGALDYRDSTGRQSSTVPQPFSTLHDDVIKVDYQDDGVFDPLPTQAVFQHISKACQPPPRIIVVSYVSSFATETHISALAAWSHTSTPPIYVFSPLETRLRVRQSLADELHHAIPISMYAWPVGCVPSGTPSPRSTHAPSPRSAGQGGSPTSGIRPRSASGEVQGSATATSSRILRQASADSRVLPAPHSRSAPGSSPRTYPPDPVATLSVFTDDQLANPSPGAEAAGDRIPLWMLAPGAGILHGSTSASLGVKLSDFSAVNLDRTDKPGAARVHEQAGLGGRTSSIDRPEAVARVETSLDDMRRAGVVPTVSLPPLDPVVRRTMAATPEPISRPGSANSTRSRKINGVIIGPTRGDATDNQARMVTTHLTPPNQDPRRLSPPDCKPPGPVAAAAGTSSTSHSPSPSQQSWPRTKSWPTTRERVPGWKRGRREIMEDALEELGAPDGAEWASTCGSVHTDVRERKLERLAVMPSGEHATDNSEADGGLIDVEDVVMAALALCE